MAQAIDHLVRINILLVLTRATLSDQHYNPIWAQNTTGATPTNIEPLRHLYPDNTVKRIIQAQASNCDSHTDKDRLRGQCPRTTMPADHHPENSLRTIITLYNLDLLLLLPIQFRYDTMVVQTSISMSIPTQMHFQLTQNRSEVAAIVISRNHHQRRSPCKERRFPLITAAVILRLLPLKSSIAYVWSTAGTRPTMQWD
jgi:hypothetical protein